MTHPLQQVLADVNGGTFISIDTATVPKLGGGKKNPYQGRVHKVTVGSNVMVFTNKNSNAYCNMVKRRLEQEGKDPGSFEVGERQWGERIAGTPFIEHEGQLYLEVIYLRPGPTHFELDGQVIDRSAVPNLVEPKASEQGGLSNKVIIRTVKVENIRQVTVNKTVHKLS